MLKDHKVTATIAVKDLAVARAFYEQKLGLPVADSADGFYVAFDSAGAPLLVYRSDYAGGYKATVATWNVTSGLEELVSELDARGVTFLHYDDMPGTRDGHVHKNGGMKNAWAQDPDGNILSFVSEA